MNAERVQFYQHADGQVDVMTDHWPHMLEIASTVLEMGQPYVEADETGYVSFSVRNGCAFYELLRTAEQGTFNVYTCRLVRGFVGFDP
jgi:hypothetical protein